MGYLTIWKDLPLFPRRPELFFRYWNLLERTWMHWRLKTPNRSRRNYVFYQLYDTIKEVAKTYANVDRYYMSGVAKGQASADLQLGAFNVPPGSVVVTAGGQTLKENVDYVVDYNLGTVKIINQAIINSGVPVNVQYENNAKFWHTAQRIYGTET